MRVSGLLSAPWRCVPPKKLLVGYSDVTVAHAAPAELGAWFLNTTGLTGYNGLPANVQTVSYSDSNVYVACSGIPAYGIGPWPGWRSGKGAPYSMSAAARVVASGLKWAPPWAVAVNLLDPSLRSG